MYSIGSSSNISTSCSAHQNRLFAKRRRSLTSESHVGQDDLLAEQTEGVDGLEHGPMASHLHHHREEPQGRRHQLKRSVYSQLFPSSLPTDQVLLDALSERRRHIPHTGNKALQLRESVGVLHGVQLSNLADGRADLLQNARRLIIILVADQPDATASKKNSNSHRLSAQVAPSSDICATSRRCHLRSDCP